MIVIPIKKFIKITAIILAAAFLVYAAYYFSDSRREKGAINKYSDAVTEYGFMYNVDGNLILAVIKAESNYRENVRSAKGAIGLMQIMPATAQFIAQKLGEEYNENQLNDYRTNIRYGTYYLSYLSERFSDTETKLAAYNAGEGNVKSWLEKYSDDGKTLNQIPFKETEIYVAKVKSFYSRLRKTYNY